MTEIAESHLAQQPAAKPDGLTDGWHNHAGYRAIFCAAVSGSSSDPNCSPKHIAEFAMNVVREAIVLTGEAAVPAGEKADGRWVIHFADADVPHELFAGHRAGECAWRRFEQVSIGYNCYLFEQIAGPSAVTNPAEVRDRFASEKQAGAEVEFDEALERVVARAFDPKLFSDDEREAHMAASPRKVEFARARLIGRLRPVVDAVLTTIKPSQPKKVMLTDEAVSAWLGDFIDRNPHSSTAQMILYGILHFCTPAKDEVRERLRDAVIDGAREVRGNPTMGALPWQRFWHATDALTAHESARAQS